MVNSAAKRARREKLAHERQDRELARQTRQMDPVDLTDPELEEEEEEVRFAPRGQSTEQMPATPATAQAASGCVNEDIANMIRTLNGAIAALSRDTASMQKAYIQLRAENVARDKTLADLTEIVRECGLTSTARRPQPDGDGNLTRPGSRRFTIDRPPTDTTGDVDTISTDHWLQGYRPAAYNGSTTSP